MLQLSRLCRCSRYHYTFPSRSLYCQ